MNRAGCLRRNVARNTVGKRKLLEQFLDALGIMCNVGIELAVRSFETSVGERSWAAVSGTSDLNHIQVVLFNQTVEVDVDEG